MPFTWRGFGYFTLMKIPPEPWPVEPEKLKPVLHEKIERMDGEQLALLSQVLHQLEAEECAERLGEGFNRDHEAGVLRRIPELVKQFRAEQRSA